MLEKIYLSLPFFFQNILISIAAIPLEIRRRSGPPPTFIEANEIEEFHSERISAALRNASKSKYWNNVFSKYNVDVFASDIRKELEKLPVVDKQEIVKNSRDISINARNLIELKTSGTTGSGLKLTTTRYAESIMWSFFKRYRARFGINSSDWCGYFCGRTLKKPDDFISPNYRVNYLGKQIMYSCYHLCDSSVESYVKSLNEYQPPWIHGYPSFLALLSNLALEREMKLKYKPKAVTLGSESVSLQQREKIYSFFGVEPSELYCQTEGVAMISECEFGHLHVDEEFSLVEFSRLDENSELYEVIGTSFYNESFPLFRYNTGDIVELSNEHCRCGGGRMIKTIDGRKEEYLVLPGGIKLGRLDHIFKSMVNVKEAQILQRSDLSVSFRVVKGDEYKSVDEELLKIEINKRFPATVKYNLDYVEKIERTKSGKLRFVIRDFQDTDDNIQ